MKHLVSFFVIILITFSFNNVKSEELLVAYINMEKVMNETTAGKSLIQQLEKIHKKYIGEFNKAEELYTACLDMKPKDPLKKRVNDSYVG